MRLHHRSTFAYKHKHFIFIRERSYWIICKVQSTHLLVPFAHVLPTYSSGKALSTNHLSLVWLRNWSVSLTQGRHVNCICEQTVLFPDVLLCLESCGDKTCKKKHFSERRTAHLRLKKTFWKTMQMCWVATVCWRISLTVYQASALRQILSLSCTNIFHKQSCCADRNNVSN